MKIKDLPNCPEWLSDADTINEDVEMINNTVVWNSGTWNSGTWIDGIWVYGTWNSGTWHSGIWVDGTWVNGNWTYGTWNSGTWHNGIWHNGTWNSGTWHNGTWDRGVWNSGTWITGTWQGGVWNYGTWNSGTWQGGLWESGVWHNGTWLNGTWNSGTWHNGIWQGIENPILYRLALAGITVSQGVATGYRATTYDGKGKFTKNFIQKEGTFTEKELPKGLPVTSIVKAWTSFNDHSTCQLWRVEFALEDLLDCDGEKARICGGTFTKIAKPF